MDTKAAFEKWAIQKGMSIEAGCLTGMYASLPTYDAWIAWQDSRAAIEIELPAVFPYEHDDLSADVPVMDSRKVKKAITSHGIRIKGKQS